MKKCELICATIIIFAAIIARIFNIDSFIQYIGAMAAGFLFGKTH